MMLSLHRMKRLLWLPPIILVLYINLFSQSQNQTVIPKPPDSLAIAVFQSTTPSFDSLKLHQGDSVFIYGGELYYRARAGGKDFFVSRQVLLSHADSLVIYQTTRIGAGAQNTSTADTSVAKIERQRCTMITKNGTRCKRIAEPGSDRCWQHKK
jgi:hypothetical protein